MKLDSSEVEIASTLFYVQNNRPKRPANNVFRRIIHGDRTKRKGVNSAPVSRESFREIRKTEESGD